MLVQRHFLLKHCMPSFFGTLVALRAVEDFSTMKIAPITIVFIRIGVVGSF